MRRMRRSSTSSMAPSMKKPTLMPVRGGGAA